MPGIDGEELKRRLIKTEETFEGVRLLTEEFIRQRISQFRNWSPTEVDEIAEKVFQKIRRALSSYDPKRGNNPFSWFMTIVDHAIIDYYRAHKIPIESLSEPKQIPEEEIKEPYEPPDLDSQTPTAAYRQKRAHTILIEAMSRMEIKEREMLLLITLFPELTYKEIMKITGHPSEAAAKECKYRMAKKMREVLKEMGFGWGMFGEVSRPE